MATDTGFGKVKLFDDFLGDVIADQYSTGAETGGTGGSTAITAAVNGALRITTDDQTDGDRIALTYQLNWQASDGGMIMEARIKNVTAITLRTLFVGFTDVLAASTVVEMPIEMSGSTVTSTATDAVGFMYDTASTNDTWYGIGVKADSDATPVDTGVAPVAGTYQTLRVVVNADGDADFYINGKYEGHVDDAITASVDCTPIIALEAQGAAGAKIVDVDYLYVEGGRN